MSQRPLRTVASVVLRGCLLTAAVVAAGGCGIPAFFGLVLRNAEETGDHLEEAEYTNMTEQSFGVIIAADRSIQADHPSLVQYLTQRVTAELMENTDATGVVPADRVLGYQYNNPSWSAREYIEIADEFGVDRLVVIDLQEFRLHDPGNSYLWDGQAAASVVVLERDSITPNDFAFRKFLQVGFPDTNGLGPAQLREEVVRTELAIRLSNRISWLFYDKEVPNSLPY
ncbi:MAG: hypothetical protein AAF108_06860 [Planctomycetota bacterium]